MNENKKYNYNTTNQQEINANEMTNRINQNLFYNEKPGSGLTRISHRQTVSQPPTLDQYQPCFNFGISSSTETGKMINDPEHNKKNQDITRAYPSFRKPKVLPELGQPGAMDDPLRRGLSGAGVRWYLRYLAQNLSPEEARRKAEEHRNKGMNSTSQKEPQKRSYESVKPESTEIKRQKKDDKPSSSINKQRTTDGASIYDRDIKTIKMMVVPKDYPGPGASLSQRQLTHLEEAIIEEVSIGWQVKLKFEGIHFKSGYLAIDCETKETSEWLKERVPHLSKWKGPRIEARTEKDMQNRHVVTMFLPRGFGQPPEKLLAILDAQNEGLCTKTWRILTCNKKSNGQLLSAEIDSKSLSTIDSCNYFLYYRFGMIQIRGQRFKRAVVEHSSENQNKTAEKHNIFMVEDSNGSEGKTTQTKEKVTLSDEDDVVEINNVSIKKEWEADDEQTLILRHVV